MIRISMAKLTAVTLLTVASVTGISVTATSGAHGPAVVHQAVADGSSPFSNGNTIWE
jgi:hypothetical protein